ncbi:MAG TPA: hypothetical protein VFR60_00675 [Sphingomicrobium sp.]|jgi:hypothetical protein|nr:hypothetical protein [Sphingomicrobium sp.]
MRSNERLQRILATRQLGGVPAAAVAEPASDLVGDLRLFALTFAAGFLFTSIFIA